MEEYLIITKEQADAVRGRYGSYSAIEPIALPDGKFFVPERCMVDSDLQDALSTLQTMDDDKQTIEDLPEVGFPCVSGQTYHYSVGVESGYTEFVICRQSHTRMDYYPWDTPALFTFGRANSDFLEWIPNEYVYVEWVRIYSGVSYQVLTEHMTQSDWTPPQTLGTLWGAIGGADWAVGVAYTVNQEVSYNGNAYKCLQAHTSQAGWEPPNVPALWELL